MASGLDDESPLAATEVHYLRSASTGVSFRHEQDYADSHRDLAARVFVGIGANETHEGRRREAINLPARQRDLATAWRIDMVDDARRFVGALRRRAYPGLRLHSDVFPDELHVTVPLLTLSRDLRVLFDAPR